MSFQNRVVQLQSALPLTKDTFYSFADFTGDKTADLCAIVTGENTDGVIELRTVINESNFSKLLPNIKTNATLKEFPRGTTTWQVGRYKRQIKSAYPDLIGIKWANTGSDSVEVHVSSAESGHKHWHEQCGSAFTGSYFAGGPEKGWHWSMVDFYGSGVLDLVGIHTLNSESGTVEVFVASGSSRYRETREWKKTTFHCEHGNGSWSVAPWSSKESRDLVYIKAANTGGNVEVYIASFESDYMNRMVSTPTTFTAPDQNGVWTMARITHHFAPDLVYVKTQNGGGPFAEVYVASSMSYSGTSTLETSSSNVRLSDDRLTLHARCKKNDGSEQESSFPLSIVLGVIDGEFHWGKGGFEADARNIRLEDLLLKAELKNADGTWSQDIINLGDKFVNKDGILEAFGVPTLVHINESQNEQVIEAFSAAMASPKYPEGKVMVTEEPDGATLFYVNAGARAETAPTFIKSYDANVTASLLHIAQQKGKKIEQVSGDVFTAKAGAEIQTLAIGGDEIPVYAGVSAGVALVDVQASLFNLKLGAGLDTGGGIKDQSVDIKVAGCGVSVGRKMGISVFGNEFAIDFGRLLD